MKISGVNKVFKRALEDALTELGSEFPQVVRDFEESNDRWRDIERRMALIRVFDQQIYEEFIAQGAMHEFSFQYLLEKGLIQEILGCNGYYRGIMPSPTGPPQNMDYEVLLDVTRLLAHRLEFDTIWLLPLLVTLRDAKAVEVFEKLIKEALDPILLKLDRAEQIVGTVASLEKSDQFSKVFDHWHARLASWKLFSQEYYKSGRYLHRTDLHERMESFRTGPDWLIAVYAAGGMGKTMFLRRVITREWIPAGCSVAIIDFDFVGYRYLARAPWLVLYPIAKQLAAQIPSSIFSRFLGRQDWERFLEPAHKIGRESGTATPMGSEASERRGSMEDYAHSFVSELPSDIVVLLVFDTTEEPYLHDVEPFTGLLDLFRLIHDLNQNVKVILSGRYDVFGKKNLGSTGLLAERVIGLAEKFTVGRAKSIEINGFSEKETEETLSQAYGLREILSKEMLHIIFEKSKDQSQRALPFNVALWGRELREHPKWSVEYVRAQQIDIVYLVERVLERIPTQLVRWLVRYCALPRKVFVDLAREVLMPEVLIQQAIETNDTGDDANADMPRKIYDRNIMEPAEFDQVWGQLLAYSAGPEEGWITPNPMGNDRSIILHPHVVEPMRRLVAKQPVWAKLHRAAQQWFEHRALQAGSVGSEKWVSAMCEAIFHAFQQGTEPGTTLWYATTSLLRQKDWEAMATLSQVVLGDARTEFMDNEELLTASDMGRIPETITAQAAEASLRAALWMLAIEDCPFAISLTQQNVGRQSLRWLGTSPPKTHLFRPVLEVIKAMQGSPSSISDTVLNQLKEASFRKRSPDALLLRLILARVHESLGHSTLAMSIYSAAKQLHLTWRHMETPITRNQMLTLYAGAMARLGTAGEAKALAIEALLTSSSDSQIDDVQIRLQAAEAWMAVGQPKHARSLLEVKKEGMAVLNKVRLRILETESWMAVCRLEQAEAALTTAENSLKFVDSSRCGQLSFAYSVARGTLFSRQMKCKEARATLTESYFAALKQGFLDEAWRIGNVLVRHMLVSEKSVNETASFLDAIGSLARERMSSQDEANRLKSAMELAELNLRAVVIAEGSLNDNSQKWIERVRAVAQRHPDPILKASGAAILCTYGQGRIEELTEALLQIETPTARLLPLEYLDYGLIRPVPSGMDKVDGLFRLAFCEERLPPSGISPGRLRAAEFFLFCGAYSSAIKEIELVARAAAKEDNQRLLVEVNRMAFFCLDLDLNQKPVAQPKSPLQWVALLEHIERELARINNPIKSRGRFRKLRPLVARLLRKRNLHSLQNTSFAPRICEVAAHWISLTKQSNASQHWSDAASLWQKLGCLSRSETCRQKAFLPKLPMSWSVPEPQLRIAKTIEQTLQIDFDDIIRITVEITHSMFEWHGKTYNVQLPLILMSIIGEQSLRLAYQEIIKLWTRKEPLEELKRLSGFKLGDGPAIWAIKSSANIVVDMFPWEMTIEGEVNNLSRTGADLEQNAFQISQWIQRRLLDSGLVHGLSLDGFIGPQTRRALMKLNFPQRLTIGDLLREVRILVKGNAKLPQRPLMTVLDSKTDSDLDTLIHRSFFFQVVHAADYGWSQAIASIQTSAPALILVESAIEDSNETGAFQLQTRVPLRIDEFLEIIKGAPYGPGHWPVVLIDAQLMGSDREDKRTILRRNQFCAQLWNSGLFSAIIGTCQVGRMRFDKSLRRKQAIVKCAEEWASVSDTARMLRSEEWGPLARSTAVWTWHPQIPFCWQTGKVNEEYH